MVVQFLFNGLVTGSLYVLLGVSFALILSMTGRLHVAYVVTFVLAPYVGIWFVRNVGMSHAVGVVGGLLAATVLGVMIEAFIYRPLASRAQLRRADSLIPIFIASLGITIAGENLIQLVFGPSALAFNVLSISSVSFGPIRTTNLNVVIIVLCWAIIVALTLFLRYARLGKQMRAVRENPLLASVVGIKPSHIRLLVFAMASAMAGVLGEISAIQAGVQPFMGFDQIFSAFVVAFLAGPARSPLVIGAVALVVGQIAGGLGGKFYGGEYAPLVLFSVLLVFVAGRSMRDTRVALRLRAGANRIRPSFAR